jgi:hypothetical protein
MSTLALLWLLLDAILVCVLLWDDICFVWTTLALLWLMLNVMLICVLLYVSFLFEQHYTSVVVVGCSITSVVSIEYSIGLCVVII